MPKGGGEILLGRQRDGHVNAGLCYPPSGFFDLEDVQLDNRVDIDANLIREMREETGLDLRELTRRPGYWLVFHGAQICIATVFESHEGAHELQHKIRQNLEQQEGDGTGPELADVLFAGSMDEVHSLQIPGYAEVLLRLMLR